MDLERKKKEFWSKGFQKENRFWIDKWGDGSVKLNPQVAQWDDGNDDDGDGWTKECIIEGDYSWTVQPDLNNRSYWVPKCGSGVFDGGLEECDDKNQDDGDGWDNNCTIPLGFKWDHSGKTHFFSIWINNIHNTAYSWRNKQLIP